MWPFHPAISKCQSLIPLTTKTLNIWICNWRHHPNKNCLVREFTTNWYKKYVKSNSLTLELRGVNCSCIFLMLDSLDSFYLICNKMESYATSWWLWTEGRNLYFFIEPSIPVGAPVSLLQCTLFALPTVGCMHEGLKARGQKPRACNECLHPIMGKEKKSAM